MIKLNSIWDVDDTKKDEWGFPDTVWSAVIKAKDKESLGCREKLGYLLSRYWEPAFRYIRFAWKKSDDEAMDLTQEYFRVFLEKDYIDPASPEKGRFRTYIKVTLKHFMINYKRDQMAKKRGGGSKPVSVDAIGFELRESSYEKDPFESFDREWARTVLSRAMKEMKNELKDQNKELYIDLFDAFYFQQQEGEEQGYEDIAKKKGIKRTDVKNHLTYARKLMRRIIKEEISAYVTDESEVEDELKYLLSIKL